MEDEYEKFEITDYDIENEFNIDRPRRKLTKNQQIYGIWADESDEEEVNAKVASGLGKSRHSYSMPLAFVKGGVQQAGEKTKDKENKLKEESGSSNEEFEEEVVMVKSKRKRRDGKTISMEIGEWQRHTKGIGHKLLMQMGYQPGKGLGKDLQGISAPIEAHKRQGRGAIGAYGKETKAQPANIGGSDTQENDGASERASHWKKSEGKKKKIKYIVKSVDEVLEEGKSRSFGYVEKSSCAQVKVIDMTGPQQRVLSGYHAIHGQQIPDEDDQHIVLDKSEAKFQMPELQHNLDLLVDQAEQEIIKLERKKSYAEDRIVHLNHEEILLNKQIEQEKKLISRLEMVFESIEEIESKSIDSRTLSECSSLFNKLQSDYNEEYSYYGLNYLAPTIVFPLVKTYLQEWQPLENAVFATEIFKEWKELLESSMVDSNGRDAYHLMVWECWMPRVRAAISMWVCRNSDPLIELLEQWMPLLPTIVLNNILDQIVLPKLQKEVGDWNPLTDTVPIHAWIHPWLPLMGSSRLESIYPTIRHKLANALVNWHPSDRSAKMILSPWSRVWNSGVLEAFLIKNIVPKLHMSMQEFVISPNQQHLEQWNWVMEWKDLLSPATISGILEKTFFPKWLQVLAAWLNHNPSYDEVTKWYLGWKSLIPEEVLNQPSTKENLTSALQLMQRSMGIQPTVREPLYMPGAPTRPEVFAPAGRNSSVPQGFKELVERRCEERGILFIPMHGKSYEGKQVYRCGQLQVHIDRNVIFVLKDGKWIPTSLQHTLDTAGSD